MTVAATDPNDPTVDEFKKSPPPATPQGDATVGPASPPDPPPARHGPVRPVTPLHGISHLRAALNLRDADLERLCEDAACELERLREGNRKRFIWD